MATIASAVPFPTLDLKADGDGRLLQTITTWVEEEHLVHGTSGSQAYGDFKALIDRWTTRENVRDVVWSGTILDAVDEEYVRNFRSGPALNHFGDSEAPAWNEALQEYYQAIIGVLGVMWKDKLQTANLIAASDTSSPDAIALEHAPDKLAWVCRIRAAGGISHMPFLTKSFLEDLLSRVEDCALAFEWVSLSTVSFCETGTRN